MQLTAYGKLVCAALALMLLSGQVGGMEDAAAYTRMPLADLARKASGNDARAQFELGVRFNEGRGVPKNTTEALRWLREAAWRGHIEAQRLLALKYYHGYGVPMDHTEALRWAQRLAEANDVRGQMMLAAMYANGEGTPRQLIRAYAWYAIAATAALEAGDAIVRELGDMAKAQRDYTATLLKPDEEAAAQKMASDWWLRKAKVKLPRPSPPAAGPR